MITSSGSGFARKLQFQTGSMSNILLRTDGFKKVVKGLSYKRNSCNNLRSSQNIHTSMGKRSVMKHQELGKQSDTKEHDLYESQKSYQFRRTKTADYMRKNKVVICQDREKQFIENERSEKQSFDNICDKLGI